MAGFSDVLDDVTTLAVLGVVVVGGLWLYRTFGGGGNQGPCGSTGLEGELESWLTGCEEQASANADMGGENFGLQSNTWG